MIVFTHNFSFLSFLPCRIFLEAGFPFVAFIGYSINSMKYRNSVSIAFCSRRANVS